MEKILKTRINKHFIQYPVMTFRRLFVIALQVVLVSTLSFQFTSFNTLSAQNKMLSSKQLMSRQLYPDRPVRGVQFVGNTNKVAYVKDSAIFICGNYGAVNACLTLSSFNKMMVAAGEKELSYIPEFKFVNEKEILFTTGTKIFLYNISKRTFSAVANYERGLENMDMEPNTYRYAYTAGNNLYINNNGKVFSIEDPDHDIVYGQSVHRNEFGINKGTFWSPKGSYLAFYRMDQSMVTDYPLVNTSTRIATTEPFKYPMAGMKSHEVTVGIYNAATEKIIYLNTRKDNSVEERENYLTNLTWSPDEKYLYIAKINRAQNHMWLERYNVETGNLDKVLFEETNPRYVEPCEGLYFIPGHPDQFLWFSMRDGYKHLYLYNTEGTMLRQLTSGPFEVEELVGFDAKGENVFVNANKEDLTGLYAYKVNIKNGTMQLLTPDPGTHHVVVNNAGNTVIDIFSSLTVPSRGVVRGDNGKQKYLLYNSPNPLDGYAMPDIKLDTIKAADGVTNLYYRLITPPNMKEGEKYPTLVYVYGGPHSQLVTNSWLGGANLYFLFLAQQGYVVFTVDNRGTDNRGFEFESCTHRQLGTIELADQMEGVRFLQSLPFVDKDRIGVEGWSFGGFMTITMKLAHPEIFKVGCAGGPVIDWKWYEVMYGERYMDTPDENPEGYRNNSLVAKAGDLQGRLLVIHGAEDNTVVWQNSIEFVQACIKNQKLVDYFIYPHHQHNVLGYDRIHLYEKMFDYYETFLK